MVKGNRRYINAAVGAAVALAAALGVDACGVEVGRTAQGLSGVLVFGMSMWSALSPKEANGTKNA